jgi:2-alkyl-3-oxoalkanoate reductase
VSDAAGAIWAAVANDADGIFNIVDDEPARMRDWLPALAAALGGPAPEHREPAEVGTERTTGRDGASNEKALRQLGWSPRVSSWREGFARQGSA